MKNIAHEKIMQFIVLVTMLVLGTSFYLQYAHGLEPCPLCLMQRICTLLILIVSLTSLCIHTPARLKPFAITQIIFSVAGLYFAIRHLWIMSLADHDIPACLPGLNVLIHYFPWKDLFHALLWGSSDCTEMTWRFLGLSLPAWAGLYFLCMVAANALLFYQLYRYPTQTK